MNSRDCAPRNGHRLDHKTGNSVLISLLAGKCSRRRVCPRLQPPPAFFERRFPARESIKQPAKVGVFDVKFGREKLYFGPRRRPQAQGDLLHPRRRLPTIRDGSSQGVRRLGGTYQPGQVKLLKLIGHPRNPFAVWTLLRSVAREATSRFPAIGLDPLSVAQLQPMRVEPHGSGA